MITDGLLSLGCLINSDTLDWMKDSGQWWYDKNVASGETLPEIGVIFVHAILLFLWFLENLQSILGGIRLPKIKWHSHQEDVSG